MLRIAGRPRARVNRSVPLTVTLSLTRRWIAGEKLSHPPVPILNAFYVRLLEPAKTDRNGRMYECWRGHSATGLAHPSPNSAKRAAPRTRRRRMPPARPRSTGRDLGTHRSPDRGGRQRFGGHPHPGFLPACYYRSYQKYMVKWAPGKIPWGPIHLVAGAGFEPATSGL